MDNGRKNIERLMYFLMGSAVAAGVALLISPRSGREHREILAAKAKEGKDFLGTQFRRGRELVLKGKEKAQEQAQELGSRAKEAAKQQAEAVRSSVEEMKKS